MDIHKETVERRLREAVWASKEVQQQLIQELASRPEENLGAVLAIVSNYDKPLLPMAVEIIHNIGYPRNAVAISYLVNLVADQNVPGRLKAIYALEDMDVDAVIPFFLDVLLKRNDENSSWSYDVDGIVSVLAAKKEWLLACGPTVAYLLAQHDYKPDNAPDLDYLLSALEELVPICSYAIPVLCEIALRENNDNGRLARSILFLFDRETLKPYQHLLALLPPE